MVSQSQLRAQQLQAAASSTKDTRAAIAQQKKQITEVKKKLKPTKTELLTQTRGQAIKRVQSKQETQKDISSREQLISAVESDVASQEKLIGKESKRISDIQKGERLADAVIDKGVAFASLGLDNNIQRQAFNDRLAARRGFKQRTKALKELGDGDFSKGIAKFKEQKLIQKEFGDLNKLDLDKLSTSQLNRFEKAGLVTITTTDIPSPIAPSKDFKKLIGSKTLTFQDVISQGGTIGKLPAKKSRIQRADDVAKLFTTPEGVLSLFEGAAEIVLKTGDIGGEQVDKILKRFGVSEENIFRKEGPIKRETARTIIRDIFVFSAFNPFIKTATAKKSSTKAKATQETVKRTDKEKIKKLAELRKEIKIASKDKVKSFVKKQIDEISKSNLPPKEKALRLRNLEIFVREARGQIKVVDGKVVPIVDIGKIVVKKTGITPPTIPAGTIDIPVPTTVKLEKLPELLTGVAAVQEIKKDLKLKGPALKSKSAQDTKQDTKQTTVTLQAPLSLLKPKQTLKSKSAQSPKLSAPPQLITTPVLKAPTQSSFGKSSQPIKGKVLLDPLGGDDIKRISRQVKVRPSSGYIAQAKDKGKWMTISKPLKSRALAENLGRWAADNSTSARYRVREVKNPREFGSRTAPYTTPLKFRGFKIVKGKKVLLKNEAIELRKNRIDTPGEKKGLKLAKLIKQRFGDKKKPKKVLGPRVTLRG